MHRSKLSLLILALVFGSATTALAGQWTRTTSQKYGFSMLVPTGTTLAAKELGGGWGALWAKSGPATLWGIAKLGTQHSANDIESFAVKVTGIPANFWKLIGQGKNQDGWKWYKMYQASNSTWVVWAAVGTGPKRSYLLILKTTVADATAHTADYKKWATSVKLF